MVYIQHFVIWFGEIAKSQNFNIFLKKVKKRLWPFRVNTVKLHTPPHCFFCNLAVKISCKRRISTKTKVCSELHLDKGKNKVTFAYIYENKQFSQLCKELCILLQVDIWMDYHRNWNAALRSINKIKCHIGSFDALIPHKFIPGKDYTVDTLVVLGW